eukprot:14656815-Ditylum_brightwellii.AAC.1
MVAPVYKTRCYLDLIRWMDLEHFQSFTSAVDTATPATDFAKNTTTLNDGNETDNDDNGKDASTISFVITNEQEISNIAINEDKDLLIESSNDVAEKETKSDSQ